MTAEDHDAKRKRLIPEAGSWPSVRIPCVLIGGLLATLEALGQPMGLHDDDLLLAEERDGPYHVALYGRPRGTELWALSVVVSPIVHAIAVLSFETISYRAPFDQAGVATVAALPVELIIGQPQLLTVTIEPHIG
jgi:hypothetical protein